MLLCNIFLLEDFLRNIKLHYMKLTLQFPFDDALETHYGDNNVNCHL